MIAPGDHQQYREQRFAGLTLPETTLTGAEFDGCTFESCTFTGSTFYQCRLIHCCLVGCDLSLLRVRNSLFIDVRFEGCKAIGIDWTQAGETKASKRIMSVSFSRCSLDYSNFAGLRLQHAQLAGCSAREIDLTDADLTGADCRGTDFTEARFDHTNLERADFTGATNYDIDPTTNRVKGAKFSLPEAVRLLRAFGVVIE